MPEWKPQWLTNRAKIAAIVFEVNELSTFQDAELIADKVCEAFGITPDGPFITPEAA